MTLLVMPTLSCNIGCLYCFQRPTIGRPSPRIHYKPDWEAIKESILNIISKTNHREVVLHGGEPLITPLRDLVEFIRWAVRNGLRVSVQTNGTLITEEHIRIFKEYDVSVGISVDGFEDINLLRGFHVKGFDPDSIASRAYRRRVIKVIERLAGETTVSGRRVLGGVIIILSKVNAGDEGRLSRLAEFIDWLYSLGVDSGRLNPMYAVTDYARRFELSNEELFKAYRFLWERLRGKVRMWSPYNDVINLLLGDFTNVVCWFSGCSYWDSFVWTVLPDGTVASCDRTLADGIWTRGSLPPVRIRALMRVYGDKYRYPHLHMFGCPAESMSGDWREPSRFLEAFEMLIDYMAREIKTLFPWYKLTNEYPDKIDFLDKRLRGCRYSYLTGEFQCDT